MIESAPEKLHLRNPVLIIGLSQDTRRGGGHLWVLFRIASGCALGAGWGVPIPPHPPHPLPDCVPLLCIFINRADIRAGLRVASEQQENCPGPNLQHVHLCKHLRKEVAFENMALV